MNNHLPPIEYAEIREVNTVIKIKEDNSTNPLHEMEVEMSIIY
jgi:hypothetical protein